jgi:hypothetical protein
MLVIQIALGIVLAWLIINHFDAVIETLFSILNAIFYPFRLIANIVLDTIGFFRLHFAVIVKGVAVVALIFVAILCVVGLFEIGIELMPKYWKDNAPTVVVIGVIIAGALVTLKDACVFLFEKFTKLKKNED